jgi:serine/threonine-protein kinase
MICPSCEAANDAAAADCIACGQPLAERPSAPRPGSLFAGRYQILEVLGRGGMGMVYKAHDTQLDDTVALKVIRPDLARESHLHERFRSEIKLARRIRHRNVCSIYGDGDEQGILWICMELVDGLDLRRLLRSKGALPRPEAYDVAIQVAEGLQAMHEAGIIHRDLKTANVMRDSRGVVRLMDFGLAKRSHAEESAGPTASGHVVGTPDYMSPEQARGEKLTFASDLYALGVIGFELFTGEPPFRGDTPLTTLLKHLNEPPPFESDAGRRLPAAVVPVLRKALAKRPVDRYASAGDILRDLRAAQARRGDDAAATPLRVARVTNRTPTLDGTAPTAPGGENTEDMSQARPRASQPSATGTASWNRPLTARRWGGTWLLVPLGVAALVVVTAPLLTTRYYMAPMKLPSPMARPSVAAAMEERMPADREAAERASAERKAAAQYGIPPPALTMPSVPTTVPRPAAAAMPRPTATSVAPSPEAFVDTSGTLEHVPVRCMIADVEPLLTATLRRELPAGAPSRVHYRTELRDRYSVVEMSRSGSRLTATLPKPRLEASPVSYYISVAMPDGRVVRTSEFHAVVAVTSGECPSRVAPER